MTRVKTVGIAALGLVIALAAGYVWGAWGGWQKAAALADCQQERAIDEARRQLLQARVELFSKNFGAATRHLEAATSALEEMARALESAGRHEAASLAREAIPLADDARARATAVDETANARAGDALDALERAIDTTTVPPR